MTLDKIAELVFVVVMLLFLSIVVLSLLVLITILQELSAADIDLWIRVLFFLGMTGFYFYIMKMIVDKIKDCNRYNS